jgi:hypothetical protein
VPSRSRGTSSGQNASHTHAWRQCPKEAPMSWPSGRVLVLLIIGAALSGCSGSGSSGKPSAGSHDGVSPGSASIHNGSPTGQRPSTVRVTGQVLFVGGPAPGLPSVLRYGGTVVFTGTPTVHAPLDTNGRFLVHLSPGTYRVTATSPDYMNGRGVCEAAQPVRVTDGGRASVKVYCQIR